jgi:hypothetical protein
MSDDQISVLHRRLDAQDAILSEIKTAIIGNPSLGQDGMIPRIKKAEKRLDDHDKTMLKWAGIATGLSVVVTVLKDRIFS